MCVCVISCSYCNSIFATVGGRWVTKSMWGVVDKRELIHLDHVPGWCVVVHMTWKNRRVIATWNEVSEQKICDVNWSKHISDAKQNMATMVCHVKTFDVFLWRNSVDGLFTPLESLTPCLANKYKQNCSYAGVSKFTTSRRVQEGKCFAHELG